MTDRPKDGELSFCGGGRVEGPLVPDAGRPAGDSLATIGAHRLLGSMIRHFPADADLDVHVRRSDGVLEGRASVLIGVEYVHVFFAISFSRVVAAVGSEMIDLEVQKRAREFAATAARARLAEERRQESGVWEEH